MVYRNGDWHFIPVSSLPQGRRIEHDSEFTFAEGEATGHFHTIVSDTPEDMEVVEFEKELYVNLLKPAKITHPEHSLRGDLVVPEGLYLLTQRREKDWFQLTTRKVVD